MKRNLYDCQCCRKLQLFRNTCCLLQTFSECQGILPSESWRSWTRGHEVPALLDSLVFLLLRSHFIFAPAPMFLLKEWRHVWLQFLLAQKNNIHFNWNIYFWVIYPLLAFSPFNSFMGTICISYIHKLFYARLHLRF